MANSSNVDAILEAVKIELERAEAKNGPFHSAHEAYAVMLEEVDELWDQVKKKRSNRDTVNMAEECIQIAASAVRFIVDICKEQDVKK